jgi:hypothetical protein
MRSLAKAYSAPLLKLATNRNLVPSNLNSHDHNSTTKHVYHHRHLISPLLIIAITALSTWQRKCQNQPSPSNRPQRGNVSVHERHVYPVGNANGNATSNIPVPHVRHTATNANTPRMMAHQHPSWISHTQVTCRRTQHHLLSNPVLRR